MKRFTEKVALVTGGNSGIGRATALAFARDGAKVVIAARRETLALAVVEEIKKDDGEAVFIKTDVSQQLQVQNLFNKVKKIYGRLDFAFNNAGVMAPMRRTDKSTTDTWDEVININLFGVWLCMKYEIQQMLHQGGGVIVNNASTAGIGGLPGSAIYSASKHGVIGLTKSAAAEYTTENIRVNAVCPGPIMTPMLEELFGVKPQMKDAFLSRIPMNRFGTPEEIAGVVLWLCSHEASFMTGCSIVVGGGQTVIP